MGVKGIRLSAGRADAKMSYVISERFHGFKYVDLLRRSGQG